MRMLVGFREAIQLDLVASQRHGSYCDDVACRACQMLALGAFLSAMSRWEVFLEEAIVREMGRVRVRKGSDQDGRTASECDLLQQLRGTLYDADSGSVMPGATSRGYILLHEPEMVRAVSEHWVPGSVVGATMLESGSTVERLIAVRHAAAHGTSHAREVLQTIVRFYLPECQEELEAGAFLASRGRDGALVLTHLFDELLALVDRIECGECGV